MIKREAGLVRSLYRLKNDLEIACILQRAMALLPFLLLCRKGYKKVACIVANGENTLKPAGL
jgi:hypothetical protein